MTEHYAKKRKNKEKREGKKGKKKKISRASSPPLLSFPPAIQRSHAHKEKLKYDQIPSLDLIKGDERYKLIITCLSFNTGKEKKKGQNVATHTRVRLK